MDSNPYSSPSANLLGTTAGSVAVEAVTQGVIRQLERTRPWVVFLAVMAFLGAALMILLGGVMVLGGLLGGSGGPSLGGPEPQVIMFGGAAIYVIMGVLCIYPGIKMWKYAARISDLARTRTSLDLESALNEQRVLWKFMGISTIIMIGLTIAFVLLGVVAGLMGATALGRLH